jgi:hypothetical protein
LGLKNETNIKTIGNIVPDNWVYVHDKSVKMGRFQIYNNWSPYLVKDIDNTVWVGLEYFCNEGDELWSMTDDDFAKMAIKEMVKINVLDNEDEVMDYHVERVKKAYPAYFDTYESVTGGFVTAQRLQQEYRELTDQVFLVLSHLKAHAIVQFFQGKNQLGRDPLLRGTLSDTTEGNISRDLGEEHVKAVRSIGGHGVPRSQIRIVQTLLRVLTVTQNIVSNGI